MAAADHLQVPRQHGLFKHHGIDLGDGTVAHYLEGREILRSPVEEFSRGQPVSVVPYPEGSCSAPVIDQVKGRRAQGEIRAPETERPDGPALRFESEGPVIGPVRPREGERVTPVDAQKRGAHGTP